MHPVVIQVGRSESFRTLQLKHGIVLCLNKDAHVWMMEHKQFRFSPSRYTSFSVLCYHKFELFGIRNGF